MAGIVREMNGSDIVASVKRQGVCVIPGYWSRDLCDRIIGDINAVVKNRREIVCVDRYNADHRIFGFENLSEAVRKEFYSELSILNVLRALYGVGKINGTILGQFVDGDVHNIGSGVSWHRDSYVPQYKAFIFLTDVAHDAGPFEYYPGTHTWSSKIYGFFKGGVRSIRALDFSDDEF